MPRQGFTDKSQPFKHATRDRSATLTSQEAIMSSTELTPRQLPSALLAPYLLAAAGQVLQGIALAPALRRAVEEGQIQLTAEQAAMKGQGLSGPTQVPAALRMPTRRTVQFAGATLEAMSTLNPSAPATLREEHVVKIKQLEDALLLLGRLEAGDLDAAKAVQEIYREVSQRANAGQIRDIA
jgi:hypothetical protein